MAQSRRGVAQILEAQVHPLVIVILRFIQILEPLSPLKPMAQSRRGAPHLQVVLSILKPAGSAGATVQLAIVLPELLKVMSVMAEPIIATWSAPAAFARLGGIVLPSDEEPHAAIEPSALTATQSRRGVARVMEAQVHPLVVVIPRFIQLILEPSALTATKALKFE
jgi:hypothetical protein